MARKLPAALLAHQFKKGAKKAGVKKGKKVSSKSTKSTKSSGMKKSRKGY